MADQPLTPSPNPPTVFLSYSRNDQDAATLLRAEIERAGPKVFKDDDSTRAGELWLNRLQDEIERCGAFVVLVGRDGVRRWIAAEVQVALRRSIRGHDDAARLPIFLVLLGGTDPASLPSSLQAYQATTWTGTDPLPESLIQAICDRTLLPAVAVRFEGCPFVGLAAYGPDQANLFFGRQRETLDALACFDMRQAGRVVRWLEISGNTGSGKSSLMNAGLLPLINSGWLWPRTGFAQWRCIGPLIPGEHPVAMLAEHLAHDFGEEIADIRKRLADGDEALADWLRTRRPNDDTAFLLAIDQFEELFTFADPAERGRFDRLLAAALDDADCPLFVLSTVRADFTDRFEDLPSLVGVRNRMGKTWTLAPIGEDGLREVIAGPARLAGLDVREVEEAILAEARDEPGALPLVENALAWLWQEREDSRLSGRKLTEMGGIAGILSRGADDLLNSLEPWQRDRALELLFRLVKVDPEGRRHTRRQIAHAEAVAVAGDGEAGRALVARLAGERRRDGGAAQGPLRLITVTGDESAGNGTRWVNLIHETLIRSKPDAAGKPLPYWKTLWDYVEKHKHRAAHRERLQLLAQEWRQRRGLARLFGLAGWSSLWGYRRLAAPWSLEFRYLRWSRATAAVQVAVLAVILSVIGETVVWVEQRELPVDAVLVRLAYLLGLGVPVPDLVEVPAGSFMMGGNAYASERPVHPVAINQPFYLGRTEVTFREWDACVAAGGCYGYRPADQGWGRETRPVINVSWDDVQAYVAWLSSVTGTTCRLPSEAEWEYAARAGTTTAYALPAPGGSSDIRDRALANCADCGSEWDLRQTAPVASFPANGWGLYDTHGNVFEWIEDCWHGSYEGAPQDGRAWDAADGGTCASRVLRGGSWDFDRDFARSAFRVRYSPYYRDDNVGFRVVCSSPIAGF